MSGAKEFVLVCIVVLVISCLTSAMSVKDAESQINELYENLLQREYTGPVSLADHQMERKAVRSPTLRLRFGRRSDPNFPPILGKFMEKVNQKPIRSPSLRLRFGRRNDPDFPPNFDLLNEEFQQQQHEENQQMVADQPKLQQQLTPEQQHQGFAREERKPARLRWGRSAPGAFSSAMDEMTRELRAPRLRWGRSDGGANYNNELKDLTDYELATLAIQYLINNQQARLAEEHQLQQFSGEDAVNSNSNNNNNNNNAKN